MAITFGFFSASGQALDFPSRIDANLELQPNTYLVKGQNVVSSGVNLIIKPGTVLIFETDASITVEGGLKMEGQAKNFILFNSQTPDQPGQGFIITEGSNQNIIASYCKFSNLAKPFVFSKNWSRKEVSFNNNQFKDLHHSGVFLEFQEIDKILTSQLVNINITGNTFSNNTGGVLLSKASWDLLKINITNNVFTRNEFIGRDLNGIFTTPIFMNYNINTERNREPVIRNNSICYNYGSLVMEDTVEFFPTYLTVVGTADFLDINQNYFGDNAETEFDALTKEMLSSQRAPLLVYNRLLDKPNMDNNGHIYKIGVNGQRVDNVNFDVSIDGETELIELIANKPVFPSTEFKINYIYLEDDTLRYEAVEHKLDYQFNNMRMDITIKDRIIKMKEFGYLQVSGLMDENGFDVPTVNIGLKNFLIKNRIFVMGYNNFVKVPKLIQSTPRLYYTGDLPANSGNASDTGSVFLTNELDPEDTLMRKKYWYIGVKAGTTMYFGDLAYTNVTLYLPNARPNIGFRFGYQFTNRFGLMLTQNNLLIAGSDDRGSISGHKRGTNFERGLSFRTWVYDFGLTGEYQLARYRKIKSIVPSIYGGISGYYFNPQAEVDGTYYNLRPIGTEGQTMNGATNTYNKFSVAIPFGIKLSKHLNKYTLFSVSYTYNKLFTDYLDDVSTGQFQSDEDLINANPKLGAIAPKLANPNGMTPGLNRSSSDDFDGYSYFGIAVTRKLR